MRYTRMSNTVQRRYSRLGRTSWYMRFKFIIILLIIVLLIVYIPSLLWESLRLLLKTHDTLVAAKKFLGRENHSLQNIALIAIIVFAVSGILFLALQLLKGKKH